jgi:hypothetical protein
MLTAIHLLFAGDVTKQHVSFVAFSTVNANCA